MESNSEIVHSLLELLFVEGLVVVIIGDLEFLANSRNTSGTSGGNFLLNVLENLSFSGVLWDTSLTSTTWWLALNLWSVENVVILLGSWLGGFTGPSLGAHTFSRLFRELPGIVHHCHEVHVVVDGATDIVVVLLELLLGDDVVGRVIVAHSVGGLEGLQEFLEDLVLGLLTSLYVWVLVGLVDTSDIVDVDPAVTVLVELLEGLGDDLLSGHVHGASDGAEELVVRDGAIAVDIEVVEEGADLCLVEPEHVVVHRLAELVLVQRLRVVVVHYLELSLQADDAASASSCELLLQLHGEGLWVGSTNGSSSGSSGATATSSSLLGSS